MNLRPSRSLTSQRTRAPARMAQQPRPPTRVYSQPQAAPPPRVYVDEYGRYVDAYGNLVDAYGRPLELAPVAGAHWLEGETGLRMPRRRGGQFGPAANVSPNLQIRARQGYRAIVQETAPGSRQYLVSEVPSSVVQGIGDGIVDLALKAVIAAVKGLVNAVQKGKEKKGEGGGGGAEDVGCYGRPCRCGS